MSTFVLCAVPTENVMLDKAEISWLRRYLLEQDAKRPRPGDDDYSGVDAIMLRAVINKVAGLWKLVGGDPTLDEIMEEITG